MIWPLSMISFFSLYLIDYYVNQDMKLEKKEQVFSNSDEFQKKNILMEEKNIFQHTCSKNVHCFSMHARLVYIFFV